MVRGHRKNLSTRERAIRDTFGSRSKPILVTKFFDLHALRVLGLEDCCSLMLAHGGLGEFMDRNAPTYKEITCDFLCSLVNNVEDESIRFILLGKEYRMSYASLKAIFGVTADSTPNWNDPSDGPFHLWLNATGQELEPAHSEYNYKFTHPPLRLAHKVLAMTFFGQGEVNKINIMDLTTLWSLVPTCHAIPDWIALFIASCLKHQSRSTGKISMGGMITLIARACIGADEFPAPLSGSSVYDLDTLRRTHVLEGNATQGFTWLSLADRSHRMRLPRPMPFGPRHRDFRLPSDPPGAGAQEEDDADMAADAEEEYVAPAHAPMSDGAGTSAGYAGYDSYGGYDGYSGASYDDSDWRGDVVEQLGRLSVRQDDMYAQFSDFGRSIREVQATQEEMQQDIAAMRRAQEEYYRGAGPYYPPHYPPHYPPPQ